MTQNNISSHIDNYFIEVYGQDYLNSYYKYINQHTVDYIRVRNNINYDIEKRLYDYNIIVEKFIDNIYKVKNDPNNYIGKTIEFVIGDYYIQSLSSMLPPYVLNPTKGEKVVDLCAAPGSKTTQISEMMDYSGFLVANEIDIKRVKTLAHNLDKYKAYNTSIMINRGELLSKYFDDEFDKVLADVPCTGLGILNKKNEIKNWWSKKIVDAILDIQYKLLLAAIRVAKVGGTIVYSTCSLTIEENEYIVDKILKNYPVEVIDFDLPVPSHPSKLEYKGDQYNPELLKAKRTFPWEIQSEGFYICKLRKIDKLDAKEKFSKVDKPNDYFYFGNNKNSDYIKYLADYFGLDYGLFSDKLFLIRGNDIYMSTIETPVEYLNYFNRTGIKIGTINKFDQIVPHTYFTQIFSNKIANNIVDVDSLQLKNYLMGSNFNIDADNGYKVVRYNGNMIGTIIVKDKTAKSQFPKSKRSQDIIIK